MTLEEMNEIYLKWEPIRKEIEEVFYFCLNNSERWKNLVNDPEELAHFDFIGEQVSVTTIYQEYEGIKQQVWLFPAKYVFASRCDILIWLKEEEKEELRKKEQERENKRKMGEERRRAKELKRLAELKAKYEGVTR